MVAEFIDQKNGNLTHALRDDDAAKSWLTRVGVDEMAFTRCRNTPCTIVFLLQEWLGKSATYTLTKNLGILRSFGVYSVTSMDEARPLLEKLKVNPGRWSAHFNSPRYELSFLSYRVVLLLTLASESPRGELLRNLMSIGIAPTSDIRAILALAALPAIKLNTVPTVTPIPPRNAPDTVKPTEEKITLEQVLSSDDAALKAILSIADMTFEKVRGVPVTTASIALSWIGTKSNAINPEIRPYMELLGSFPAESLQEFSPLLKTLDSRKIPHYRACFAEGDHRPILLTPRAVAAICLIRNYKRSYELRELLGVGGSSKVYDYLRSVFPEVRTPETKKEAKTQSPVLEVVKPVQDAVLPPSNKAIALIQTMRSLFDMLDAGTEIQPAIQELSAKVKEIDERIVELQRDRKRNNDILEALINYTKES